VRVEEKTCEEKKGLILCLMDMTTKKHKRDIPDGESRGGRIYWTNTSLHLCVFTAFTNYLSMLNPDCEQFFQRPKCQPVSVPWFDKGTVW